ncbi:NAD(P)/FAD-dependent oxidoreductase [Dehalobacter sp. DCM]|uniref:FAD-dependent oxidoreductase n=1 Tax=Dehalobacter sp. DCM TaxID=2907827 RepID=UPI003081EAF9|nr:NAD(P)/FAD-dependent oxidoreductase [Dehalobacter sp. DCM]
MKYYKHLFSAIKIGNTIDMLPFNQIGQGGSVMNMTALMAKLDELNVKFIFESKMENVEEDGIVISGKNNVKRKIPCDTIVLALGLRPDTDLGEELQDKLTCEVVCIGDCAVSQGTLKNAVSMAHCAAYNIL